MAPFGCDTNLRGSGPTIPLRARPPLPQVTQVLQALANAGHWTPHLPLLEVQAAGLLEARFLSADAQVQQEQQAQHQQGGAPADRRKAQPQAQQQEGGGAPAPRQQSQQQPAASPGSGGIVWQLYSLAQLGQQGRPPAALLRLLPAVLRRWAADDGWGSSRRRARQLCSLAWSLAVFDEVAGDYGREVSPCALSGSKALCLVLDAAQAH